MNIEAAYHAHTYAIPAALALLPGQMDSPEAHAMLLAIGLQESGFEDRVQLPAGPARSYWQFEKGGGVRGVLKVTPMYLLPALHVLNYAASENVLHEAMAHNDVLAAVMARLLLWTLPGGLPRIDQPSRGWEQYLAAWRPGKPRPATWPTNFTTAWKLTTGEG